MNHNIKNQSRNDNRNDGENRSSVYSGNNQDGCSDQKPEGDSFRSVCHSISEPVISPTPLQVQPLASPDRAARLAHHRQCLAACDRLSNESHGITVRINAVLAVPPGKLDTVKLRQLCDERDEVGQRWNAATRELIAAGVACGF